MIQEWMKDIFNGATLLYDDSDPATVRWPMMSTAMKKIGSVLWSEVYAATEIDGMTELQLLEKPVRRINGDNAERRVFTHKVVLTSLGEKTLRDKIEVLPADENPLPALAIVLINAIASDLIRVFNAFEKKGGLDKKSRDLLCSYSQFIILAGAGHLDVLHSMLHKLTKDIDVDSLIKKLDGPSKNENNKSLKDLIESVLELNS